MDKKRKKVGLVLGGGGTKGLAHIGVLKVLEENNIPIDLIVGTSMGAAVGALSALGLGYGEIEQIFMDEIKLKDLLNLRIPNFVGEFVEEDKIEKWIYQLIEGKSFNDVKVPLVITAVDINTGEQVVIEEGDIAAAIRATISVPPTIRPIMHQGRLLGDGWMAGPLPADIAKRMGMDVVIGIYLDTEDATRILNESNINGLEYMNRCYNILSNHLLAFEEKDCDVVIKPRVGDIAVGGGVEEFLDKKVIASDIVAGEAAAIMVLEEIKKLL